ncbi:MAG TPA: hypothetical protein VF297_12330 [Pyrinomonadaceae bacterium]
MGRRVEMGSGAGAGAKRARRSGAAYVATVLALLACVLGRPDAASAQWTTPDAGNNINNTNTGNVGVGTGASAPAGRLDVKGATSDSAASALNVRNSSDANLLFVRNDGRIGIGTTSPSVLLHMSTGATRAEFNMQTSHTSGPIIRFRQDGGAAVDRAVGALNFLNEAGATVSQIVAAYPGTDSSKSFLKFTTSATEALRITSNGSVGVGTTTPAYRLDVAGQVRSSSGGFVFPDGTTQTTASTGTVTGVNAGAGLSGGGSGGSLTLSVAAGTGINAGAGGVSVNYGSTSGTAVQGNTTLTVTAGSGLTGGGQLALGAGGTLTLANDDKGSAQNIFKNVANAAGAVQFSAGSNSDSISFEGTGGTTVSFNAGAKRVTINSSATAASGWTDGGANLTTTNTSARVGIGTASPTQLLDVSGAGEVKARAVGTTSAALQLQESSGTSTWSEWQQYFDRLRLNTNDGTTVRGDVLSILPNGNVGIGAVPAVNSGYKLDVAGSINATQNINATGTITGGTITATYQDVAEWVPSVQKLAAGTVVVLDTDRTNHVVASASAYDTKVAGVISAQPGVILGVASEGKVKVATTGRVKVKVDASRGAIKVGDLLVTSDVEGVAMKSEPISIGGRQIHAPGTIVGKALEPLESGTGEILVLLSLQ